MAFSEQQRRFIFMDQGIGAGITIFIIMSVISRYYSNSTEPVPLWGDAGIAYQTLKVAFLLPLISCFLITTATKIRINKGKLEPLVDGPIVKPVSFLAKQSLPIRALLLGLTGVLCIAAPTIVLLNVYGLTELTRDAYLWFKPAFISVVAVMIMPVSSWTALVVRPGGSG